MIKLRNMLSEIHHSMSMQSIIYFNFSSDPEGICCITQYGSTVYIGIAMVYSH